MNRLACIGIRVDGADHYGRTIEALLAEGVTEQGPGASALTTWQDPSGAGLVASIGPGGDVECVNPTFFGDSRLEVIPRRLASDPRCAYCDPVVADVIGSDGHVLLPLALQVDDLALSRPRLPFDQPATVACTGFAQDLAAFTDEVAFDAWQSGNPVRHAAESALSSGLFAGEGEETPEILLSGVVVAAELRVNQSSGSPFHWMRVRSLPGEVEVVAPVESFAAPPDAGNIVHGTVWMVGRIVRGLLPGPAPRPSRRFGLRRPGGRRR